MRRLYYLGTLLVCATFNIGCVKQSIPLYNDTHYIQFVDHVDDVTTLSFYFHAGHNEVTLGFPVRLIGPVPEQDLEYFIDIVGQETTAALDNYHIPPLLTFRKDHVIDTAYITFRNSPSLASEDLQVTFYIKSGSSVEAGQTEYIVHKVILNDKVSKPAWWDNNIDRFYLGPYSEAKYRAFMKVTNIGELSQLDEHQRRILMLQFKYYLIEMKERGTPLLLEDGSDMLDSVPLIG